MGQTIGVLTGGGDCPGLNPVIRAVTRRVLMGGLTVLGIKNGWRGLVENDTTPLTFDAISGIVHRGGTILGTSRTNPYQQPEELKKLLETYRALKLDALVAIGGEDTLGVAAKLVKEGLRVVGIPKTIDNDLSMTDVTFGFDTAVNVAMEAIDRLHTTAESHHRIMVVEVMGRHAGWIAVHAGIAGGADFILIPEVAIDVKQVCESVNKRHALGKGFSIIVVAEGAKFNDGTMVAKAGKLDAFGHMRLGGVGQVLADRIEEATGFETRVTVLGHIQRGGSPTAFDRVLGTRFGIKAAELVLAGDFGKMVSLQGNRIVAVPLNEQAVTMRTVDPEFYNLAKIFFG